MHVGVDALLEPQLEQLADEGQGAGRAGRAGRVVLRLERGRHGPRAEVDVGAHRDEPRGELERRAAGDRDEAVGALAVEGARARRRQSDPQARRGALVELEHGLARRRGRALVEGARADGGVERGAQRRLVQSHRDERERRIRLGDAGGDPVDREPRVVEALVGREPAFAQPALALESQPRELGVGVERPARGEEPVALGLELARVEPRHDVAATHDVALVDEHLDEGAAGLEGEIARARRLQPRRVGARDGVARRAHRLERRHRRDGRRGGQVPRVGAHPDDGRAARDDARGQRDAADEDRDRREPAPAGPVRRAPGRGGIGRAVRPGVRRGACRGVCRVVRHRGGSRAAGDGPTCVLF